LWVIDSDIDTSVWIKFEMTISACDYQWKGKFTETCLFN